MSTRASKPSPSSPKATDSKPGPDWFARFAAMASAYMGSRWAFAGAILVIVVWAIMGPVYRYSDTWQLVINTGTTIVTFLMVFLIQNTQNRDARAINLKLNELIYAIDKAKDQMIDIENLSDQELEKTHYPVREDSRRVPGAQDATVSWGLTRAEKEITGDCSPVSKCRFGRYFYLLSVATSVSVAQEDRSSARFDRTFSEWKLRLNSGPATLSSA